MSTTTAQDTTAARGVRPRESAPDLTVPLLRGGTNHLTDQRPRTFTMVVFFRGLHCPVCRAQLTELNRRLGELEQAGIDVMPSAARPVSARPSLPRTAGSSVARWPTGSPKPRCEPGGCSSPAQSTTSSPRSQRAGLFLIAPDHTVYYESILSMPVGRPRLDDLLGGAD
jgi:hypothetical protein